MALLLFGLLIVLTIIVGVLVEAAGWEERMLFQIFNVAMVTAGLGFRMPPLLWLGIWCGILIAWVIWRWRDDCR